MNLENKPHTNSIEFITDGDNRRGALLVWQHLIGQFLAVPN